MAANPYHPLRVSSPELEYANPYMRVSRWRAQFQGFHKDYYVADLGPRAAVLVTGPRGVLLVRQYRFLLGEVSHELPGGGLEPGETPAQAARRECLEEAGVRCGSLEPLLDFELALETCQSQTHLFLCRDFEELTPPPPNPREVVGSAWLPLSAGLDMIMCGAIRDSLTIIALLAFSAREGAKLACP